jgi:N,N'-diacetyllegionaminate synthase
MKNRTLIIAEAGVNHNGDLNLALKLIDVAANAGANIVKFQTFNADHLVTRYAVKANYQLRNETVPETQYDMLSRLELTGEMHRELIAHCKTRNIKFLSTAFDISSVNFLAMLGQEIYKIPSGEITNLPYLRHIGRLGKPIIISTGMSSLWEVEAAIMVLEESGVPKSQITVLQCTSQYPAPMKDVNLNAMCSMARILGVKVGLSDHTIGIEAAVAAVAMGAIVVEKHFTLDRNMTGPDHAASLEPDELNAMVLAIRNIELALGDGFKEIADSELQNRLVVRKSLVASVYIKAGELFTPENITSKRPGLGISPMRWDEIIGKKAPRNFKQDEMIEL